MVYKINGNSIVNDNREVTVDSVTVTANDRIYAGVTSTQTTPLSPSIFQGSVSGYTSGGLPGPRNTIDKFPFSVDSNATDVGDLVLTRSATGGQSSTVSGYNTGGYTPPSTNYSAIDKFPFASDTNATSVGNLSESKHGTTGTSSSTNGYASGGNTPPRVTRIEKFPFATDSSSALIGTITQARGVSAGQSSTTHGYTSGGSAPAYLNTIDKFPFATDTNATDVGDLLLPNGGNAGQSSPTHGYSSGGYVPPSSPPGAYQNVIQRFPFSSDTNATDVGDLTRNHSNLAGQSSTISGYSSGGTPPSGAGVNTIDKFPFAATTTNATDVGDLTQTRYNGTGQQARTPQ